MYTPLASGLKNSSLNYERCLNAFPRQIDVPSPIGLYARGGIETVLAGGGPCTALFEWQDRIWGIFGGFLKYYNNTSWVQAITPNLQADWKTTVAPTEYGLALVSLGRYWIISGNETAGFTATAPNTGEVATGQAQGVAFLNGFFFVVGANSAGKQDVVAWSDVGAPAAWQSLNFAAAESNGDPILAIIAHNGAFWMMGKETIEIWVPATSGNPFQRDSGATKSKGIFAQQLWTQADNAVFWIGSNRVVYRSYGGTPEAVSTRWVEDIISDPISYNPLTMFTYQDRGHQFVIITPTEDKPALAYDVTTGVWVEFSGGVGNGRFPASFGVYSNGTQVVADLDGNGSYGVVLHQYSPADAARFQDFGSEYAVEITTAPIENGGRPFTLPKIELMMTTGGTSYLGREAVIEMEIRRDGKEWSFAKQRGLGAAGEYSKRVVWFGNGRCEHLAELRFRCTDPVRRDIAGISLG